ncbi:MAG: hypothetical protein AAF899_05580 [Pseudomonadota bacterium]
MAALLLIIVAMPFQAPARTGLEGSALAGLDEAEGARLRIGRADGEGVVEGVLSTQAGASLPFAAREVDGGLSGTLQRGGAANSLRIDPLPFGAIVTLIPVAPGGALMTDRSEVLFFARSDVDLPAVPEGYVAPPGPATVRFAPLGFLRSYAFWRPDDVARGYLALAPRHRTMIGLFPTVQLDIIWKLCLAPASASAADDALILAREGQDVECRDVLAVISELQREGRFSAYKKDVDDIAQRLRQAIRCAEYFVETVEACQAAGRYMSQAAVSLETAATVLDRYR